jgi:hypothetical protein
MDQSGIPHEAIARPRKGGLRWILLGLLMAFIGGAVITFLLVKGDNWRVSDIVAMPGAQAPVATAPLGQSARPLPTPTAPQAAQEVAQRVDQMAEQTGGIDQRVAALEQRLTRLDLQTQAAEGNAARAEGMLIAFAARRALERGQPLGYLEDQLRLRFGESRPNAVATVIDAAAEPVSLDELLAQLNSLGSEVVQPPSQGGLLARMGYELSRLFSVRSDETPSPVADQRLDRARLYLENGRVERAIAEVRAMPNAAAAAGWLERAERYSAAQRALESLEAASIADPRDLRDGAGQRVEQRGPGA